MLVIISFILIVGQVWLELKMPDYMSEITRLVQTEGSAMSEVIKAGGKMMFCALLSLASSFIVGFFVAQIAAGFSMRLRGAVYDKVMSFTMEEIGDMVGFSNRQSFYASFYKITGKSPRAYRKEHEERLGNKK